MSLAWVRRAAVVAAFAAVSGTGSAWAQNSVIVGTVTDAVSGTPLAGVTVTATAPGLSAQPTATTDTTGNYRIAALPPGDYALRFDRSDYLPFSRGPVQLRPNRTIRVNVQLLIPSM